MATYMFSNPHVDKGIKATNGCYATFFKTNFNMPIKDLSTGSYTMTDGWVDTYYPTSNPQSLSGFCRGYEVLLGTTTYYYCVTDGSCLNGTGCLYLKWQCGGVDMAGDATCETICVNIQAPESGGYYQMFQYFRNIGAAPWEIDSDSVYSTSSAVDSISGDNISIGGCSVEVCLCDVPNVPATGSSGNIWVEGNNLNFVPEQQTETWEHSMVGNDNGLVAGTPGTIWIDNIHYLHWIGSNCHDYQAKWRICQFCSWFGNSSGVNPSPGAGYAGSLWADGEFGFTHLAYIGCDGNKYIVGAGEYNQTTPV